MSNKNSNVNFTVNTFFFIKDRFVEIIKPSIKNFKTSNKMCYQSNETNCIFKILRYSFASKYLLGTNLKQKNTEYISVDTKI